MHFLVRFVVLSRFFLWLDAAFLRFAASLRICFSVGGFDLDSLLYEPGTLVAPNEERHRDSFLSADRYLILKDALLNDVVTD